MWGPASHLVLMWYQVPVTAAHKLSRPPRFPSAGFTPASPSPLHQNSIPSLRPPSNSLHPQHLASSLSKVIDEVILFLKPLEGQVSVTCSLSSSRSPTMGAWIFLSCGTTGMVLIAQALRGIDCNTRKHLRIFLSMEP